MNKFAWFLLLPAAAWAANPPAVRFGDVSLHARLGYDTNPAGAGGPAGVIWGDAETLTGAAGAGFNVLFGAPPAAGPSLKLGYQGEWVRLDRWPGENFSTHRFSLAGQLASAGWKFTAEGSSLFVAGSVETLPSLATINANAITLWRERRRQWQHRLRVQGQAETGRRVLRATGTWLACDYGTRVRAGRFAFSDRSDAQVGFDLGWKQRPGSLWLAGLRAGRQTQALIPLPNCEFDYGNDYGRLAFGWEGRLPAGTSVTFAAGPDFRHFTGAIDPAAFLGGRDRASLWFEGGFTARPHPAWTLTGRATRFSWLSSTGKSAYYDSAAEVAAAWMPRTDWNLRLSAKVHRCDYFPAARDDWEWFLGAGVSRAFSPRVQLSLDILRQQAWNGLPATAEREFRRVFVQLGTTIKL